LDVNLTIIATNTIGTSKTSSANKTKIRSNNLFTQKPINDLS